jgi:hypothetical protein
MIFSRKAWAVGVIALTTGGCGGTISATPVDGGTQGTDSSDVINDAGAPDTSVKGVPDTGTMTGCVDGGITFAFAIEAGAPVCPGSAFGCNAFSDWLTITGPDGAPVQMWNPTCVDCGSCTGGCPPGPCEVPQPTTSLVDTLGWDGTVYATSTCGMQNESCGAPACAPAGHYVAKMCGYPAGADAGPGESACQVMTPAPHCVSVPFDWPLAAGTHVVGTY